MALSTPTSGLWQHLCPWALGFLPAHVWAFSPCLRYVLSAPAPSSVLDVHVPGHRPCWSELWPVDWFSGMATTLLHHYRPAWQSLGCFWHQLPPLDLTWTWPGLDGLTQTCIITTNFSGDLDSGLTPSATPGPVQLALLRYSGMRLLQVRLLSPLALLPCSVPDLLPDTGAQPVGREDYSLQLTTQKIIYRAQLLDHQTNSSKRLSRWRSFFASSSLNCYSVLWHILGVSAYNKHPLPKHSLPDK